MEEPLHEAIERARPFLEAGLADAEAELARCRARCDELERMIDRVRALFPAGLVRAPIAPRGRLYLHEAMLTVLHGQPGWTMRAPFLAGEINRRRLYQQRGGRRVTLHLIHARVHRYPQLFERAVGGIRARV